MENRSYIFRFFTFVLCSLYLLSSVGMTVFTCACSDSTELLLTAKRTASCCAKKQSCCANKQANKGNHQWQLSKKPCCSEESIALNAEHQPEQLRLSLSVETSQGVIFTAIPKTFGIVASNDMTEPLSRYTVPPKIPLIYQHSRLRL